MRPKFFIVFLLSLLSLCLYLFYMIYSGAKESAIAELNTRQKIHAKQAKSGIEYFFTDLVTYLTKVSDSDHIIHLDNQGIKELGFAFNAYPGTITAITRVDASGRIVHTIPYNAAVIGKDISSQKHINKILETHKPVVSDVFTAVQGYRAVALHVPVYSGNEFRGTLGVLINFLTIPKRFLQDIQLGETGYSFMTSSKGVEIYCPVPGHGGNFIFENSKRFPGIISMADRMMKGEEGTATFRIHRIMDQRRETVKNHAIYLPINIADSFWTIVVVSTEDEVLAALISLKNKLMMVVCLLILVSSLFSYYWMKAWGIVREERKRKETEKALEESEEKYRSIFENAVEGFFQSTPDGRFTNVNPAFAKMLGYTSPEELTTTISDIATEYYVNPDDRKAYQEILHKTGYIEHFEFKARCKYGSNIWVSNSTRAYFDHDGTVIRYEGTIQDITARKLAEEALKESQEQFSLFMDYLPALVFIKDENSRTLFINKYMNDVLGAKNWIGKTPLDLFPKDLAEAMMEDDKKTFAGGYQGIVETVPDKQGTNHIYQTYKFRIHRSGKPPLLGGIALDITKNKEAEEEKLKAQKIAAEQGKQALVGQIAGKMAHDFNNILGIIMGNTELSMIDCKDAETRKTLELIFEQTVRGKNLTKNLVAFAKDQEPKQLFFRISDKIDLVLNLMRKDLEEIELLKEESPGVPELLADPGMIEHALVNLIQNAIHALSKVDYPRITIRTYSRDDTICFEIEDNGCGIPKQHLETIYAPSFTLKGSRDATGSYRAGIKGTGYGMANVKKYIEQHKGTISVTSELGSGTRFTISLPVIKKELTNEEKKEIRTGKAYFEKFILLVEDETAISDVQYRILTQEPCNHKVDIANNGQVAMDLFGRNQYDLVSLDYILPGNINGMDIYHHIRATDKTMPILFISGNIEFLESIKELKQKDARIDHLSKPCQNKEYVKSINGLFERALAAQQ